MKNVRISDNPITAEREFHDWIGFGVAESNGAIWKETGSGIMPVSAHAQ
jgi:hypothetical protein